MYASTVCNYYKPNRDKSTVPCTVYVWMDGMDGMDGWMADGQVNQEYSSTRLSRFLGGRDVCRQDLPALIAPI